MSPRLQNLQAFLDTIAASEGTAALGQEGYDVLVGGSLFTSFADHPRQSIRVNSSLYSTAAGRYQVLARTFDGYRISLGLPDFSPASQDAIAIRLIEERHALADILAGRFAQALAKCRSAWASLPGAGYGQHENTAEHLERVFVARGGLLAS